MLIYLVVQGLLSYYLANGGCVCRGLLRYSLFVASFDILSCVCILRRDSV